MTYNTENIIHNLQKLGLHHTDAQIYISSLSLGACTVIQLADQLKLNRITTHDAVQRLIDKGLFLETHNGQRRLVYPKKVEALQSIVDKKRSELTQLQHQVEQTISLLNDIQLQSIYLPQIRFYKGREGIETVINEMLADDNDILMASDSWHFDDLIDNRFIEQASLNHNYNHHIHLIIPIGYEHFSFTHQARQSKTTIRYFGQQQHRSGGMSVRGHKVAYYSYEGHYITTTVVENKAISMMMKAVYENLRFHANK